MIVANGLVLRVGNGVLRTSTPTPTPTPTPTESVTLTQTSTSGDQLRVSAALSNITVQEAQSYYWLVEMAADAAFSQPLDGGWAIRQERRRVTTTDFTDDDGDSTVETDPFPHTLHMEHGGLVYCRMKLQRDDGTGFADVTGWSNTVSDTVTAMTASTFDPANTHANITLSNGNLTATNAGTGSGFVSSRTTQARDGKRLVALSDVAGAIKLAVVNDTYDVSVTDIDTNGSADIVRLHPSGAVDQISEVEVTDATLAYGVGDTVFAAIDYEARWVWFGVLFSGQTAIQWWDSSDPETGAGGFACPQSGTLYPIFSRWDGSSATADLLASKAEIDALGITNLPSGFEALV